MAQIGIYEMRLYAWSTPRELESATLTTAPLVGKLDENILLQVQKLQPGQQPKLHWKSGAFDTTDAQSYRKSKVVDLLVDLGDNSARKRKYQLHAPSYLLLFLWALHLDLYFLHIRFIVPSYNIYVMWASRPGTRIQLNSPCWVQPLT